MRYFSYVSIRTSNVEAIAIVTHTHTCTISIDANIINDFDTPSSPTSQTRPTIARYFRLCTLSCVQSNISAAAHRRISRIRWNCCTLIRNASNVLREVASNQIKIQAEQIEIRSESQALMNSTNAATLLFKLRLQDLECTLDLVTHNVQFMLRRLNDRKNDINLNICNDGLLDLRAATMDIVRNSA